jgi:Recombination endonuclease VII
VKPRKPRALKRHGLTDAAFTALFEAQNGRCGICGIPESELDKKYSGADDWETAHKLHIDHIHTPPGFPGPHMVRGLLCQDCNFDLEVRIIAPRVVDRNGPYGNERPPKDPRYEQAVAYLNSAPERMARILGASSEALPLDGEFLLRLFERPRACTRCARKKELAELQVDSRNATVTGKSPRYMCLDEDDCKLHEPHAKALIISRCQERAAAMKRRVAASEDSD